MNPVEKWYSDAVALDAATTVPGGTNSNGDILADWHPNPVPGWVPQSVLPTNLLIAKGWTTGWRYQEHVLPQPNMLTNSNGDTYQSGMTDEIPESLWTERAGMRWYFTTDGAFIFRVSAGKSSLLSDMMPLIQMAMIMVSAGAFSAVAGAATTVSAGGDAIVTAGTDVVSESVCSAASYGGTTAASIAEPAMTLNNLAEQVAYAITSDPISINPAITNGLGRIAVSTAMNGGNVEAAIKGYALGLGTAEFGSLAGSLSGVDAVGSACAAAAHAAIAKGNVAAAVGMALLPYAPAAVASVVDTQQPVVYPVAVSQPTPPVAPAPTATPGVPPVDTYSLNPDGSTTVTDSSGNFVDFIPASPPLIDTSPPTPALIDYGIPASSPVIPPAPASTANSYLTNPDGSQTVFDSTGAQVGTIPASAGGAAVNPSTNLTNIVTTISQAAMPVLSLIKAFTNAGSPQPYAGATAIGSNGTRITPNPNGTITTVDNRGVVSINAMPAGHPYVFPNGSTVVNNGNGTLTTIDATGASHVSALTVTATAGSSSLMLYGGIALAALFLLRR